MSDLPRVDSFNLSKTISELRAAEFTRLLMIAGSCDTVGEAIEVRSRLGVRGGDYGQSMGRRDTRSRHDEVPEAHLWVLYS